jgi:hypothetical protein
MIPTLSYNFNKYKLNIPTSDPNHKSKFRESFNKYEGLDQRYVFDNQFGNKFNNTSIYVEDLNEISKIKSNFVKLDLVNKLSSNQLSQIDKINLIKTSELDDLKYLSDKIKPFDITTGGLFKDWDFKI